MSGHRRIATLVVVAAGALVPRVAAAYPHYQFSSGTEVCADCHHAPAGGGLLTEWGRGELGDTLSMAGDGRLLHGVDQPAWLSIGGDVRLAALVNDTGGPDGAEVAVFPMQLELAVRAASGRLAASAIVGVRSAARAAEVPGDEAGGFSGLAGFSREHVIAYRVGDAWSLRAGRFAAPFGLRLADHTTYVRRHAGYGLFEETYGLGGSLRGDQRELHLTAFVSDVVQLQAALAAGVAGLFERRWPGTALLLSGRLTAASAEARALVDVAVKRWIDGPRLLLMAELAGGWQVLRDAGEGRPQVIAYAGPTWIPRRGVNVTVAAEAYAEDARLADANRYAGAVALSVLPYAHLQIALSGRYQLIGRDEHAANVMLQLHYLP